MTTVVAPQWTPEIRTDLAGLREEWTDLFRRCAEATPFQSYAWNQAWWAAYGRNGRLRVVLVRRGGTLVAAAAFTLVRRGGCAVLVPVGGAFSDFTDALADDSCRADAVRELGAALRAMPGWQAVDFPESRATVSASAPVSTPPATVSEEPDDPASTVKTSPIVGRAVVIYREES